jgi:hypothetical protein
MSLVLPACTKQLLVEEAFGNSAKTLVTLERKVRKAEEPYQ